MNWNSPMSMLRAMIVFSITAMFSIYATMAAAETYYVATDGDDANDGLSPDNGAGSVGPFATVSRAATQLEPGDTLYLRGGTYHQTAYIGNSGTEGSPITISSAPGEWAVIDGEDTLPAGTWGALVLVEGEYNVLQDIEVANSLWMGVVIRGAYSQIIGVDSHHNMEQGVFLSGDYTVADRCRIWWNARSNEYGSWTRSSWGTGISAGRHPSHATIRRCEVFNNWGEGLSTFEAEYTTIEDNVVYDNQTNIYLSDTIGTVCRRNLVYSTPGNVCAESQGRQTGIMMGDEVYDPPSSDNRVINNLVMGNKTNFYWWQGSSGGGLVNTLIAHNTFVDSVDTTCFQISGGDHSNTRVINNIIVQNDDLRVDIVVSSDGLAFSHNLWSTTPSTGASGDDDIVDDPLLALDGTFEPGELDPHHFAITNDSPAYDSAIALEEVADDYFGTPRDERPDRGGYEYSEADADADADGDGDVDGDGDGDGDGDVDGDGDGDVDGDGDGDGDGDTEASGCTCMTGARRGSSGVRMMGYALKFLMNLE